MNCGSCAKGVLATLSGVAPDAKTQFDLDAKEVRIEALDAEPILGAAYRWLASTSHYRLSQRDRDILCHIREKHRRRPRIIKRVQPPIRI